MGTGPRRTPKLLEHIGVDPVRLRQAAHGLGELAHTQRIDDGVGNRGTVALLGDHVFVAPRGLNHQVQLLATTLLQPCRPGLRRPREPLCSTGRSARDI